jgi:hypothetical protein
MGWSNLTNGELLRAAESQFDLLISTDQNLRYQQNLVGKPLAIVVLMTTSWPTIQRHIELVDAAVLEAQPSLMREVHFPS